MYGMMVCRIIMAGVKLGIYAELCRGPASSKRLSANLGLNSEGASLLLDSLCSIGHLARAETNYTIKPKVKKWLDPVSPTYIGGFLEFNYDQWEWWSKLDEVVQTGKAVDIHQFGPDDPRWDATSPPCSSSPASQLRRSRETIRLPQGATQILDMAGGHGWFSAELCNLHPGLAATVLDLPGSAAIGRKIIADAGMSDRVTHKEGDLLNDDLGGPTTPY
jgi:hypothetical protein